MGKLHAIGNLEIGIFGRDHRPAHSHVLHPGRRRPGRLRSLAVLRGSLPRQHRQEVLAWAALNRAILVAEWNRLDPDISV